MGNPIPTLKVVLILIIAVNAVWFTDRLLSLIGMDLLGLLPSTVWQLLSAFGSGLLIIFNVLLLGLLPKLQLKPE
ncbi:hypothetical protein [Pseudomonas turukhanskensis]|uniref:Uncharacterized protein n=1 Tax=Pseudomonas turukhanskensis TaxID=1806536 RepID=A0A9W6K2J7_9PSED|nr:hypothetical protein [Pseudomonas turukhanskensis]GLK87617.1 hypothetical protein GCM10017655_06790 [Pseudomonas turukhanskensis]